MLMVMKGRWLQWIRRIHLYLSVFFTPLLLLFIITGWAQTVGFDQTSIMKNFSEVHTRQYFPMTRTIHGAKGEKLTLAGQTGTSKSGRQIMIWPTKWLVVAMCVSLMVSISLGLVLAFTMVRNRIPVWIALILGVATPVLLLALAHVG